MNSSFLSSAFVVFAFAATVFCAGACDSGGDDLVSETDTTSDTGQAPDCDAYCVKFLECYGDSVVWTHEDCLGICNDFAQEPQWICATACDHSMACDGGWMDCFDECSA